MLVKRLAAYTHLSFLNIAIYQWRVIDFQLSREVNERFLPHFAFPWVRPWDNRGKCLV